jgi:hypothetical protein
MSEKTLKMMFFRPFRGFCLMVLGLRACLKISFGDKQITQTKENKS